MDKIRLSGIVKESTVDGPGLRYVIFTQGCPHHCLGCHNPHTHDYNGGTLVDVETILDEIKANPLLSGITFSGGECFLQPKQCAYIAKEARKLNLNIYAYTGYLYEDLLRMPEVLDFLDQIDILIDGPFILKERNLLLTFRGSNNQRVIDLKETKKQNKIVLHEFEVV